MSTVATEDEKNIVPAITRAANIFNILEQNSAGIGIRQIAAQVGAPRTTVYRILNSLELHGLVRRTNSGDYLLGGRLVSLAAAVPSDSNYADLARIATPHMENLAKNIGEGCKLSVIQGKSTLVIAVAGSAREYSLTVNKGQRVPLHAGAAGKVLLAYLDTKERKKLLSSPLSRYTVHTQTDSDKLEQELSKICERGWSEDIGEYTQSINAFAAPIRLQNGDVVASLSVPFIAGKDEKTRTSIMDSTVTCASAISAELPE